MISKEQMLEARKKMRNLLINNAENETLVDLLSTPILFISQIYDEDGNEQPIDEKIFVKMTDNELHANLLKLIEQCDSLFKQVNEKNDIIARMTKEHYKLEGTIRYYEEKYGNHETTSLSE